MATRPKLGARDGHTRIIDRILDATRLALEEHLPAIEKALHETGGALPASITITAGWKDEGDEGLVLTVKAKSSLPATVTTYKASISGGQLTLFDGEPASE